MKYDFIPLDFRRLAPEEQRRRATEFYELMKRRRTVREFSPDPVPLELIELAIKTAGVAPFEKTLRTSPIVASSHRK